MERAAYGNAVGKRLQKKIFSSNTCGKSPMAATFFKNPFAAAEVCGRVVTIIVASVSFAVPSSAEGDDV